jgi:predicted PurR-regulated permease PerM
LKPLTLRWVVLGFAAGAFFTFWQLWTPLVLAAWFAHLARPLNVRLSRWMGKKERGAAVATVLLVILGLTPIALIVLSLAADARQMISRATESGGAMQALGVLIGNNDGENQLPSAGQLDANAAAALARKHGMSAFGTLSRIAGATTSAIIGLVVFVYGFYVFLVRGTAISNWIHDHAPMDRRYVSRFGAAFIETGRGLIVGFGLTASLQGLVATIGYLVIGLSHALVLGLLTAIAAFLPAIGTGLVWVPLAIALAARGSWGKAAAVLGIGMVISIADNFIRPALSRYGKLDLSVFVLFVAMLGGFAAFGAWGIVLGPLLVRLALEGLEILREERIKQRPAAS